MKVKIIANEDQLREWSLISEFKTGCVCDLNVINSLIGVVWYVCPTYGYNIPSSFVQPLSNRQVLAHFIETNNIRTTLVSRYLGYSKGWLTQAMTRTDRGDLDDNELQAIMDKLHIDWSSSEYVHVKATKQHTAYKTKPCSYTTDQHKSRLQQSFWNGDFIK